MPDKVRYSTLEWVCGLIGIFLLFAMIGIGLGIIFNKEPPLPCPCNMAKNKECQP